MSVPARLVGAWRRSGLILDGVRIVDHADVLWLQTPHWFADMRVRIDSSSTARPAPDWLSAEFAFAGSADWVEPIMTWHHRFDAYFATAEDSNPLRPVEGVMREEGTTDFDGREVEFAEEWLRMTDDDVTWKADVRDDGVRIEVGRFAIEIVDLRPDGGAFFAARQEWADDAWRTVRKIIVL